MIQSYVNDIINNYTDEDGLVTVDKNPTKWSTGNGLMHLGFFITLANSFGIHDLKIKERFCETIKKLEVNYGLYNRNSGRRDLNADDDLIGALSASIIYNTEHKADILLYGKEHFYFYNNSGSRDLRIIARSFLGRQIGFMLYLYACNDSEIASELLKLKLKFPHSSYKVILNYMMVESMRQINESWKSYYNGWIKRNDLYKETVIYFGANHPLSLMAKELYISRLK